MKRPLLLGTAGHIDHGKTALVKALTGVDTDRLPGEKQRGITIDLGFAPLELDDHLLGVIDVPGHERFVKNMLAGAAGIDVALLVIAVDDSVKPQTREHLEILQHMRVPSGVIALTKCDLAEPGWIDLVEAEVAELVEGTFLQQAEVVRFSTVTQQGAIALREALNRAARLAAEQRSGRSRQPFRMAIDRAFSIPGQGTVVTGSIASGVVAEGDELELQPPSDLVRVRSLQSHDRPAERLQSGQRAAINLAGIAYNQVARGHYLSTPGAFEKSRLVTAELTLSAGLPRALKQDSEVRVHLGTAEMLARVKLFKQRQLAPGATGYVQLLLREEAAVAWGQPFVMRSLSPIQTLGGGRVLESLAKRRKGLGPSEFSALSDLASDDPDRRIIGAYLLRDGARLEVSHLFAAAGVEDAGPRTRRLVEGGALREVRGDTEEAWLLHEQVFSSLRQRLLSELLAAHEKTSLKAWVERSRLITRFEGIDPALFAAMLAHLTEQGAIIVGARGVALAEWRPRLTESERASLERIEQTLTSNGLRPPSLSELCDQLDLPAEAIKPLLALATQQQRLVRLSDALYLSRQAVEGAMARLQELAAQETPMTVSEIREWLDTSRKVAVPLCEHFDAIGFTRRQGDFRRIASPNPSSRA